ncbi:MAG: hypothetical protein LBK25_04220 [Treponema sp.]|jgi:hypothetical protein|nr:hypothetical protein [Treponema sp.]
MARVSGVQCQTRGVRHAVPDARCQQRGVRRVVSDVQCQRRGVRGMVSIGTVLVEDQLPDPVSNINKKSAMAYMASYVQWALT